MTSTSEILRLNAGREIDILVAEQIIGWQIETDEPKLSKLEGYFSSRQDRRWWRAPDGGWYYDPPSYSSDIAAAWQVVESMNGSGQSMFLFQSPEEYKVAFDKLRPANPEYVSETSITLAICKAALVAAGKRIEVGVGAEYVARSPISTTALA